MIHSVVVHTTGVNFDGVLANAVAIIVILSGFTTLIVKLVKSSIETAVANVVAKEVTPVLTVIQKELRSHDTRIARLEGVEQGKRYAVDAAGVSVNKSPGT